MNRLHLIGIPCAPPSRPKAPAEKCNHSCVGSGGTVKRRNPSLMFRPMQTEVTAELVDALRRLQAGAAAELVALLAACWDKASKGES